MEEQVKQLQVPFIVQNILSSDVTFVPEGTVTKPEDAWFGKTIRFHFKAGRTSPEATLRWDLSFAVPCYVYAIGWKEPKGLNQRSYLNYSATYQGEPCTILKNCMELGVSVTDKDTQDVTVRFNHPFGDIALTSISILEIHRATIDYKVHRQKYWIRASVLHTLPPLYKVLLNEEPICIQWGEDTDRLKVWVYKSVLVNYSEYWKRRLEGPLAKPTKVHVVDNDDCDTILVSMFFQYMVNPGHVRKLFGQGKLEWQLAEDLMSLADEWQCPSLWWQMAVVLWNLADDARSVSKLMEMADQTLSYAPLAELAIQRLDYLKQKYHEDLSTELLQSLVPVDTALSKLLSKCTISVKKTYY
jgi:hypothetical protein